MLTLILILFQVTKKNAYGFKFSVINNINNHIWHNICH